MRTLVFGAMPPGATPQTHIATGPWCFAGQEETFVGWSEQGHSGYFPLPPDPYANSAAIAKAAAQANGEVLRLAALLGKELETKTTDTLGQGAKPALFWQTALSPWLVLCVHSLVERQQRVHDLITLHGSTPLRVEVLPENCPFSFTSTRDLILHGVQSVDFNHYVFSRILTALCPPAWELVTLAPKPLHQAQDVAPVSLWGQGKNWLRAYLTRLPFPLQKGFSLWQVALFSLAILLRNTQKPQNPDTSFDFSCYAGPAMSWSFPALPLIRACLPLDIAKAPRMRVPACQGKIRGFTAAFSQDDGYRLSLAAWRAGGGRLFGVQHGANYANLQSIGGIWFEYAQAAFFSWGWRAHGNFPVGARPLPHPSLVAIAGAHKERSPQLILVGTEMSSFVYRLKSRPQAQALLAYREAKVCFFQSLPPVVREQALYRPYFKTAGGLADANYMQDRLQKEGGIHLCQGDLTAQILGCRLLVLDHYGTTLHTALVANVPTLCFWDKGQWGMEPGTEILLEQLEQAGILYTSAEAAAAQVAQIWDTVPAWWTSGPVQAARQAWVRQYALCTDSAGKPLSPWQTTWLWAKALYSL